MTWRSLKYNLSSLIEDINDLIRIEVELYYLLKDYKLLQLKLYQDDIRYRNNSFKLKPLSLVIQKLITNILYLQLVRNQLEELDSTMMDDFIYKEEDEE